MNYVWLALAWALYYFLHSLLADNAVKKRLQPLFGNAYRLFYTVFATLTLAVLMVFHVRVGGVPLFHAFWLRAVGVMLAVAGAVIAWVAFRKYSLTEFTGLAQLASASRNTARNTLVTSGLQSRMRHPLYTGTLLLVWGYWLFSPSIANLIPAAVTSVYIPVGVYFEERKLVQVFGAAYENYRKAVPMLFPKL